MEITYTLSEREYLDANRAHIMLLLASGTGLLGPAVIGSVWALIVSGKIDAASLPLRIGASIAAGLLVAVILWALMVWASRLTLPRRVQTLYSQQRALAEEVRVRWDEESLASESASASTRLPWADFVRWTETDQALLLFPNGMIMYVLPKRVMDARVRQDLIARLSAHGSPHWRRWRSLTRPTRKGA